MLTFIAMAWWMTIYKLVVLVTNVILVVRTVNVLFFMPIEMRMHKLTGRPKMLLKIRTALTYSFSRPTQLPDSHENASSLLKIELRNDTAFR